MPDDIEKHKAKLEHLERLVGRYAQSRSLPMLLLLPMIVFNAILLIATIEIAGVIDKAVWLLIFILVFLWVLFSSLWLPFIILKRYGPSFYKKEGDIELEREKVPIWTWVVYAVTFVGPAFLHEFNIMPVRWAVTMSLASLGIFILYLGKKQKEIVLCIVYGILILSAALVTALGFVKPLGSEKWKHAFFVTLMAYIIGAGLITTVVVHIYNRRVLRKIKEVRPFGEQEANKSDT